MIFCLCVGNCIDCPSKLEMERLKQQHKPPRSEKEFIEMLFSEGSGYNISHPLASEDNPTDAYHRSKKKG